MFAKFTIVEVRPQALLGAVMFHRWAVPDGSVWVGFYRVGRNYLLRFPGFADFQLTQDGMEVDCWPVHGISEATIQHLYLNQVLPLQLSKQGRLVLHGSAVEIGGEAVAFVGESGRGKSTLAASFATSGSRFLTDDGLLLEWLGEACRVMPSHPSIRLWADSQDALISQGVMMAPAVEFTSKVRLLAGSEVVFCEQPRPLRRIYFLGCDISATLQFERMRPANALIALVNHSFLLDIEARDVIAKHFEELTQLVKLPIYYRLDYPRRYEELPRVREAIIQHALEEYSEVI